MKWKLKRKTVEQNKTETARNLFCMEQSGLRDIRLSLSTFKRKSKTSLVTMINITRHCWCVSVNLGAVLQVYFITYPCNQHRSTKTSYHFVWCIVCRDIHHYPVRSCHNGHLPHSNSRYPTTTAWRAVAAHCVRPTKTPLTCDEDTRTVKWPC